MHRLRRPELHAAHLPPRHRSRSPWRWLLAALPAFGLAAPALAQGPTDGALYGRLQALHGLPRRITLHLTLRSDLGGPPLELTLPNSQTFLLPHLAPGSYQLQVSGAGSVAATYPVTILLGETTELLLAADAPASASPSSPLTLLLPSPSGGLPLDQQELPDQNDDGQPSAAGLPAVQNTLVIDGAPANQSFASLPAGSGQDPAPDPDEDSDSAGLTTGPSHGLARGRHAGAPFGFSSHAVHAFRVAAQSYSAQSGNAAGIVANAVTESGSARLHGSAFFNLRSSALAATNPYSVATSYRDGVIASQLVKPHDLITHFGGTLGAPLLPRARLFGFYTFEGQRRGFPAVSSPADPAFYSLTTIQRALLATRGVTAPQVVAGLNYVSSLTGLTSRRADEDLHFLRADWQPRPAINLSIAYNRVRWTSPGGLIDAPVVARGRASLGTSSGSVDSLLLSLSTRLSRGLLNQVRVEVARNLQYESPQAPLPQEPAIAPGGLAPQVVIGTQGLLFGTPATTARTAYPDERRLTLSDSLSLLRGRHLVALGGELSLLDDRVASLTNAAGSFRYDSGETRGYAGGLVDFLTDYTFNVNTYPNGACPSIAAAAHFFCFRSFTQSFGPAQTAFTTQHWSAFAEDTWRPRPGLTLYAGLRYEYTLLPLPQRPNATLDSIFGSRGATSIFPEDRNNLGPRVSVAWQPFGAGRGTVRAGYGVFFGRLPGVTLRSALAETGLPSATTRIRITPTTITGCPQVAQQGFGYPCAYLAMPPAAVSKTGSAVVFDRRFRLPMVQRASLTLERSIGRRTAVTAGWIMNLDRQLPGTTDLNIAPSTSTATYQLQGGTGIPGVRSGDTFALPVYTTRLTPDYGPVTQLTSHANATYHALHATVATTAIPTLRLSAQFTWSKAIDLAPSLSAVPRTNAQLDPFRNGYDKGLSSLNYPFASRLEALWQPPGLHLDGAAASLLNAATRGWQFALLGTARSGRPYSYDLSGGTRLPGGSASLNGSGGALYLPTVGRNTLRLPAVLQADARLNRSFALPHIARHELRGQASLEAWNLLNRRNLSSVSQRAFLVSTPVAGVTPLVFQDAAAIAAEGLNVPAFGTPNASSTGLTRERQLRLSLRLSF